MKRLSTLDMFSPNLKVGSQFKMVKRGGLATLRAILLK